MKKFTNSETKAFWLEYRDIIKLYMRGFGAGLEVERQISGLQSYCRSVYLSELVDEFDSLEDIIDIFSEPESVRPFDEDAEMALEFLGWNKLDWRNIIEIYQEAAKPKIRLV